MPKYAITIAGSAVLTLFAGYVALVGVAIFFATLRTDFSAKVGALESEVATLETQYYDAISRIGAADVYAEGFVVPTGVSYVAQGGNASGSLTRGELPRLPGQTNSLYAP